MPRPARLFGAVLVAGSVVFGGDAATDSAYDTCIDESDGSNVAWGQCGSEWVEREDVKLNRTWKKVFSGTEGQTKEDLLAEQRAWITYKEAACAFYANGDFGREGQVLGYPNCQAEIIAERTGRLEAYGQEFEER
jgi:uncharacterized protein YecT (DUF1311 family)